MAIEWITREEADQTGSHEEQVLIEQSPAHYPEFMEFLKREMARRGDHLFFRGKSGMTYRAGLREKPDANGLRGFAVYARLIHTNQTVASEIVDEDLWPLLEWVIEGVGGEWSLDALRTTGAIYKVPGAQG